MATHKRMIIIIIIVIVMLTKINPFTSGPKIHLITLYDSAGCQETVLFNVPKPYHTDAARH